MKAAKVKFGIKKVTFHNYTISREVTEPKETNLCPIRNMREPKDITQVRAFLGCNHYINNYMESSPNPHTTSLGKESPDPHRGSKDLIIMTLPFKN